MKELIDYDAVIPSDRFAEHVVPQEVLGRAMEMCFDYISRPFYIDKEGKIIVGSTCVGVINHYSQTIDGRTGKKETEVNIEWFCKA